MENDIIEGNWEGVNRKISFECFEADQIVENKLHEAFQIMQKYYLKVAKFAENKYFEMNDLYFQLFKHMQSDLDFLYVLKNNIVIIQNENQKESELIAKVESFISNLVPNLTIKYSIEIEI